MATVALAVRRSVRGLQFANYGPHEAQLFLECVQEVCALFYAFGGHRLRCLAPPPSLLDLGVVCRPGLLETR